MADKRVKGPEQLRGMEVRRDFSISTADRQIDEDARTVEVAFSSEAPVERWWGTEILDHASGSVRLDRLRESGAVLVNHDSNQHVGTPQDVRVDSDRTGRATIRFSRSDRGEEVFRDVIDGIRRSISVGYMIHEARLESTGDGGDVYRINDWEPYEFSIVAVPADTAVGVGRSVEQYGAGKTMDDDTISADQVPEIKTEDAAAVLDAAKKELDNGKRADALRALASSYRELVPAADSMADDAIRLDVTPEQFKDKLRDAWLARKPTPVPATTRAPRIEMQMQRNGPLQGYADTREGLETAYRMGKWARAVMLGDQAAKRWCKDYGVRVMTTEVFTQGGAAVPEEMVQAIIDLRESYGVARRDCFVHPMDSDAAVIPRSTGDPTAYFVGQTEATTESDESWDNVGLNARELSALTRMSRAWAEDAVIDVASHVTGGMARAFAAKEDDCLFNGDGTSTYGGIYGIRPKIIDGTHTAGAVDAASGHDIFSEIDADDLLTVSSALADYEGIMPKWYCSKRAKALVFDALKVAGGGNTIITLEGASRKAWLEDEIEISSKMPKVITDLSDVAMLIYGDLRLGTTLGDRRGFAVQVLMERYAEYRQIGIIAWERFDLVVHSLGDNTDAGGIVALIGE